MKRRNFINTTALSLSGIAATSPALMPLFSSCSRSNRPIVLAVLGCCKESVELIAGSLQKVENVRIKTVFDFDRERMNEACQSIDRVLGYLPGQAQNMASVLEDKETDGIFIFLPEHWRATATIQACKAGKDVYVEALPAHSISEGKQMVETANATRRIVQCGYVLRSSPSVLSARNYIEEGKLGQVVHVKIYSLQKKGPVLTHPDAAIPEGFDWNTWLGPAPERPYNPQIYCRREPDGWKTFREFTAGRLSGAGNGLDLARLVTGNIVHPSSVFGFEYKSANTSVKGIPERQITTWDFGNYTMNCDSGEAYSYMNNNPKTVAGGKNFSKWLLLGNRVEVYGADGLMYLDSTSGSWQVTGKDGELMAEENEDNKGTQHVVNFLECMRDRKLPAGNIQEGHLSAALAHLGDIACKSGNKQLVFDKESETFINNEKANSFLKPEYRKEFYSV